MRDPLELSAPALLTAEGEENPQKTQALALDTNMDSGSF